MGRILRQCLAARLGRLEAAFKDRYWHGQPAPEADRLATIKMADMVEDLFTASADDLRAFMETTDGT